MAAARERSATTGTAYQLDVPSALQLYDQIGKGSYGSVFSARYQQRLAAVKAVPIEPGPDGKEMSLEIRREMELLGKCDSEYVVRFYGCMHKGRTLWIAMELCDGSVSDVLRVLSGEHFAACPSWAIVSIFSLLVFCVICVARHREDYVQTRYRRRYG